MVTKKTTVVKAKGSTSTTGKAAKKPPLKAEAKAAPAKAPAAEGAGREGSGCEGSAQGHRQGRSGGGEGDARRRPLFPPAPPAPRGRPGRKPKQTEEQLHGRRCRRAGGR